MTRVTQVLVGAGLGDATTDLALQLRALLPPGTDGGIVARHIEAPVAGVVRPLEAAGPGSASDVLLVHVSIGEPALDAWLEGRPERLALVHHDISPPGAFEAWDPAFAALLAHGHRRLPELVDRASALIAVSDHDARRLVAAGGRGVTTCPLIVDPGRLCGVRPDADTAHHLAGLDGPIVLHVGQLLPHKRADLLVQAYSILVTRHLPDAHLVLVGPQRLPAYAAALQRQVEELALPRAWLAGRLDDARLAACWAAASVWATASDHEGFCAPLLEAMAWDVPVVARARAAIPEVAGGAALLLAPSAPPAAMAEALAAAITDGSLRASLVDAGRARVAARSPKGARASWRRALAEVAG